MTFFSQFPLIPYDAVGNNNFKIVTNLLRRVAVRSKIRANTLFFDTYDVRGSDKPDRIAHKLYGDSELHWVILLVNDITDVYHQWPLQVNELDKFIHDKYGDNASGIHHYEIAQKSGDTTKLINIGSDNTDYPTATSVTNYEFEEKRQDSLRKIRLLKPEFIDSFVNEFRSLMNESIV